MNYVFYLKAYVQGTLSTFFWELHIYFQFNIEM